MSAAASLQDLQERYHRQIESLLELFVGFAILLAINVFYFPEDPGYLSVQPHPFLFLVILIASRYGTFDGFVAGLLSALVYIVYAWWGREPGVVVQAFDWTEVIAPYLFIVVGVVLGEIRASASREVDKARHEVAVLEDRVKALRKDNEVLAQVKDELQKTVLSAEDPLAHFYDSARRLSISRPEETYAAIVDLVAKFTGAEKFAIYEAEPEKEPLPGHRPVRTFRLVARYGWTAGDEFATVLTSEHPAVQRVLETLEVVTSQDIQHRAPEVLACAPMHDPVSDSVLGLIVIQKIPFVRLNQASMAHLFTIAQWAGKAIADAQRFEKAMAARVNDERTGVFNSNFMKARLEEEVTRVMRYGGVLSLVLVRFKDFELLSPEDREALLRTTGQVLKKVVRNVDLVGLYPVPGVFALILPATNANQSAVVTGRILEAFRRGPGASTSRFAHITLRFGVAGMSKEHPKTASQLMDEAERFEIGQMT